MAHSRIFLLSPARCDGERAKLVFKDAAAFPLAARLQAPAGVPLGEVFAFLSGLYFRGKLAYAQAHAAPPAPLRGRGVLVITAGRGLVPADTPVTLDDLRGFACVPVDEAEPRYLDPLRRDAAALASGLAGGEAVLLGSIATAKYVEPLLAALGERLRFPAEFVGRGDMSRGGLMLRCVRERRELEYVPVAGATRNGKRPLRLQPLAKSDD